VSVSSDGKLAFVSNYGSRSAGHSVSLIDVVAQKEIHRVDLGILGRPHGVCFLNGKFYFTAELNKLIGRYDPAERKVDWLMGTGQIGTHMVMFNDAGTIAFTANIGSNSISVFEAANWNQTVIPVGKGPEGFDISPDGKEVWVAHSGDGGVSIIDVASRKVAQTFDVKTKRSNRLKFTPDGKTVLISDMGAGDVVVLDVASRTVKKRIHAGSTVEGILMEPAGSRAYVAVTGDNKIKILDLKTLEFTGDLSTGPGPDGMAWAVRK
jgi:YVTN family beta-propeller protein